MGRYICKIYDPDNDVSDVLVLEARDAWEAKKKAKRMFCEGDWECIENMFCHCELSYEVIE